ncbi:MAG TPA: carboxypeptidase regulatory-like domain-containing protein [Pseudomonadota bacterium]|nr:carboxypeptidase regulatory-like domain-containing protein [Pseudomonadota bacterium]
MRRKNLKKPGKAARLLSAKLLPWTLVLPGALLVPQAALAQQTLAQIQGTVKDENGKPLAGVTVVVQSPALQGEQAEITDNNGRYIVTQLPPGDDYKVSFFFGADDKPRVERPGIRLSLGKTVTVNANISLSETKREVRVIRESAPVVDTASTSTGVEINQEVLKSTPVRGRTFESVMTLAPGTSDVAGKGGGAGGDVGVQISGSTGNENNYIVDGLNTSDPNLGLVGTELSNYFIQEVNVITGGYQAEFGRATGGVVNISVKSGGNEFKGSVFGSFQPFQLEPRGVARLGEALITRTRTNLLYDFGFALGGPIVKDRIWFFIGFAPTFTESLAQRRARSLTFDPGTGRAAIDPNFECPSYLADSMLCDGPKTLALRTDEISGGQDLNGISRLFNGVAKLQFNLSADHNIQLTYIGAPRTSNTYGGTRAVDLSTMRVAGEDQVHDGIFHYTGKLFARKLQLDVLYGYHYQGSKTSPEQLNIPSVSWAAAQTDPFTLADFEDVSACRRQNMQTAAGATVLFNPCPLTGYTRGYGQYSNSLLQRHQLIASATYFLKLTSAWNPFRGTHAFKVGFEFEYLDSYNDRTYTGTDLDPNNPSSGHRAYSQQPDGSIQIAREYAKQNLETKEIEHLNNFIGRSYTQNFSAYLRDSWIVDWAPGLTVNAGVRWEGQELYGSDGRRYIDIKDNWAPRIGAVYDFTQLTSRPGRSKVFFNYGRFYQSIPLDINDRQLTAEGMYSSEFVPGTQCDRVTLQPGGRAVPVPSAACNFITPDSPGMVNGGRAPLIAPGIKGQYINEFTVGLNYDVGLDIVLGVSYIHRDLGNIVEDMSPDGGTTYLLANPGVPADPTVIAQLQADVDRLKPAGTATNAKVEDQLAYQDAVALLGAYKLVGSVFPKARRNYDALVLTMNKRLSNRFSVISSYTYSRAIGNYPGTFSSSNGQLDPNISSQFDLIDLLANRNGPLPTDRPHNFKLTGFYQQPLFGDKGKLSVGLTFTATSGRPIEVLGRHVYYGRREVYLLPRGSGGRTPTVTQFDLQVSYEHQLTQAVSMRMFVDVVNLFNQREVVNVDDEFMATTVSPIINGQLADLRHLKANNGTLPTFNSNYGQPTSYQLPLFMRFGWQMSF